MHICLEAVHSRTGEGLVRGCGCGDRHGVSSPELGVAHVSCLARCNDDATLDDLREAVETLEETERTGRRVLGSAHPLVGDFELSLRAARAALRARETPPQDPVADS